VLAEVPLQGENADPHASNSRVALQDARGGNRLPAASREGESERGKDQPGGHEHQRAGPLVRRADLLLERRLLEREEGEREKVEEEENWDPDFAEFDVPKSKGKKTGGKKGVEEDEDFKIDDEFKDMFNDSDEFADDDDDY